MGNLWAYFRRIDWAAQLMVLLRHPLHFVLIALCGAAGGFAYSYIPLHASKTWKIEFLEQRVDAQNGTLRALEEQLAALRAESDAAPDAAEFREQKGALADARSEIQKLEREADKREKTVKGLRRSVDQWKARAEEAGQEIAALNARLAGPPAPAPAAPGPAPEPAAPAPGPFEDPPPGGWGATPGVPGGGDPAVPGASAAGGPPTY